jgi:glucose/arabinose dehydrogenase
LILINRYGKILRLDVDKSGSYNIPKDNPFRVNNMLMAPEIFALGFRNPWSMCFDPLGRLIVADVGMDNWEKVSSKLDYSERRGLYSVKRI